MRVLIVRRVAQALALGLLLSFLCYALLYAMPGDPLDIMAASNPHMTPADLARLKAIYGQDQPLLQRYGHWLGALLQGDLGWSRTYKVPVSELLIPRLGNTLLLTGTALALSAALAIPLGVWAARRPGGWLDRLLGLLAFAGLSLPVFFLGLLLIMVLSVKLGWLPAGGMGTVSPSAESSSEALLERLRHLIMPVLALSLGQVAVLLRYTRAAMLETLGQDYIRTARAKGLSEGAILRRHALRHALLPVITVLAMDAGMLLSGALITETIFAWQGMGKMVYDAVMGNDYPVAMVAFMLTVFLVLLMNLLADLLYAWLDPRVRLA